MAISGRVQSDASIKRVLIDGASPRKQRRSSPGVTWCFARSCARRVLVRSQLQHVKCRPSSWKLALHPRASGRSVQRPAFSSWKCQKVGGSPQRPEDGHSDHWKFQSTKSKLVRAKKTGPGTLAKTLRAEYHSSRAISDRSRNQGAAVSIQKYTLLLRPVEKFNWYGALPLCPNLRWYLLRDLQYTDVFRSQEFVRTRLSQDLRPAR